jgi:hypothetical protein
MRHAPDGKIIEIGGESQQAKRRLDASHEISCWRDIPKRE